MLPVGDDDSDRVRTPYINYLLILINFIVFIYYQRIGNNTGFTYSFVTVPAEILTGHDFVSNPQIVQDPVSGQQFHIPGLGITPIPVYLTLITSMFMHGGIAHLLGNMLYLWVFGDNIENSLGHIKYLFFYLMVGVVASLTHVFSVYLFGQNDLLPVLGASGAISGVMGAYLRLFPYKKVKILFIIFIVRVPAFLVLGLWILLQVSDGVGMLGGSQGTAIAYGAHIGGFLAGLLLIYKFKPVIYPEKKRSR